MAFRIRPLHERIFANPTPVVVEKTSESTEGEESVFVVDEETGEIREEIINTNSNGRSSTTQQTPSIKVPDLPRKESARVFGLSMKKRTKVSFM